MRYQPKYLDPPHKKRKSSNGILLFSYAIIATFLLSLFCNCATNGQTFSSIFFYDRYDTAMDFFHSVVYVSKKTPYTQYSVVYPPLANLFFYIFASFVPLDVRALWAESYLSSINMRGTTVDLRVSQYTMLPFLIFIVFLTLFTWLVSKCINGSNMEKKTYALCIFCTTGFLFSLERGNIVILAALFCCIYMQFFDSKNALLSEIALISLAAAAGLKLYPAILGVFLLWDKQYKKAFRAIIYGLFFFLVPFYFFEGNEAIALFIKKIIDFSDSSAKTSITGYSLQQIIKPLLAIAGVENWGSYVKLAKYAGYVILMVSVLLIPLVSRWKAVGLLTMAMYMSPGKISSGTLIYLALPLTFYLSNFDKQKMAKWWYFFLYYLILGMIPLPQVDYFAKLGTGYSLNLFIIQMSELLLLLTYLIDCLAEVVYKLAGQIYLSTHKTLS